jgi:copper chaperone CopZ
VKPLDVVRSLPLAVVVALLPSAASAEFTQVQLKIFGMDCATCAQGVRVGMEKIQGVESVELSLERATADLKLRQGNTLSLDKFRELVKLNGFAAKEAIVTAKGLVVSHNGKPAIEVSGVGTMLVVVADKAGISKQLAEMKPGAEVQLTGRVEQKRDGTEEIALTSIKPLP